MNSSKNRGVAALVLAFLFARDLRAAASGGRPLPHCGLRRGLGAPRRSTWEAHHIIFAFCANHSRLPGGGWQCQARDESCVSSRSEDSSRSMFIVSIGG